MQGHLAGGAWGAGVRVVQGMGCCFSPLVTVGFSLPIMSGNYLPLVNVGRHSRFPSKPVHVPIGHAQLESFNFQRVFHETPCQMLCGKGVLLNKSGSSCIPYPHWKFIIMVSEQVWVRHPVFTLMSPPDPFCWYLVEHILGKFLEILLKNTPEPYRFSNYSHSWLNDGICSEKCVVRRFCWASYEHRRTFHKPRWSSPWHTQAYCSWATDLCSV